MTENNNPIPTIDQSAFSIPHEESFAGVLGIEFDSFDMRGPVTAHIPVKTVLMQPMGIVHGGIFASISETIVSIATVLNVADDGMIAVGQSNNTSFLRPVSEGTMHAVATPIHMGRTSWLWQVDITNDQGKRCAVSTVTLAVRPQSNFERPSS